MTVGVSVRLLFHVCWFLRELAIRVPLVCSACITRVSGHHLTRAPGGVGAVAEGSSLDGRLGM